MKKLFFLISIFAYLSTPADEYLVNEKSQKIYISADDILINQKQIIVKVENDLVITTALFSDEKGLYVKVAWPLPFLCTNCGRWSSAFTFVCEHCGAPRSD